MRCSLVLCKDVELQKPFYFETITGEISSKKEGFVLCICRFGESF